MKTIKIFSSIVVTILALLIINGCYSDTIDALKTFTIQLPITVSLNNHGNSEETITRDDLNNYSDYRDNKDRIERIELYQSGFWVDTLSPYVLTNSFEFIEVILEIGGKRFTIARYDQPVVGEFIKLPHIDQVSDADAKEISDYFKNNSSFTTISRFKRKTGDNTYYEFIKSKVVVDLRIEIKL